MPQEKSCFIKSNLNHFLLVEIAGLPDQCQARPLPDTNMKGLIEINNITDQHVDKLEKKVIELQDKLMEGEIFFLFKSSPIIYLSFVDTETIAENKAKTDKETSDQKQMIKYLKDKVIDKEISIVKQMITDMKDKMENIDRSGEINPHLKKFIERKRQKFRRRRLSRRA